MPIGWPDESRRSIMIKKVLISIMFMLSAVMCLLPQPSDAGNKPLVEYQIAAVLMNEARGGGEMSMAYVADVIHNRMIEQRTKYKKYSEGLTYTDILFRKSDFEGAYQFKNKSSEALENYWLSKESKSLWETALKLAHQTVTDTLPTNLARGANSFNKTHGEKNSIFTDHRTGHYFYSMELGGFAHDPNLMTDDSGSHEYQDSDRVIPADPNSGGYGTRPDNEVEEFDQLEAAADCSFQMMKQIYMDETDNANLCWYCNVVIVLMNGFFKGAKLALPAMQTLGKLILQFGFLIWLAYYILQQVSSFAPVTPGKMLQEILNMGFKVALAYVAVLKGGEVIAYYFVNPVLSLGIDYGLALFKGLSATSFG